MSIMAPAVVAQNHLTQASKAKRIRNLFRSQPDIKIPLPNGGFVVGQSIVNSMDGEFHRNLEKFVQTASPQEIVRNAYKIANMVRER